MKNRDEGMVKTYHRKKLLVSITCVILALLLISIRLLYVCVFQSSYYLEKAQKLHERERDIKALRGEILDRNGVVLASNKTVCTVSVIHSQITQPQEVIQMLVKELAITEEAARKRVEKVSSIERVKTNVDKETGDRIKDIIHIQNYVPKFLGLQEVTIRGYLGLKRNTTHIFQVLPGRYSH